MRTGPEYFERVELEDGTYVTLRHIRPEDAEELRHAFDRLSPQSRYRRFFGAVNELTDEMLRYLTEVDGKDHVAIVAGIESPDLKTETGVGCARFVRSTEDPDVAEAAVTVVDDFQGKGLGRLLLMRIAEAARERDVKRFRAMVLKSNLPMRTLLEHAGAVVHRDDYDSLVFDVPLDGMEEVEKDASLRKILRAAASQVAGLIRSLSPPSAPEIPIADRPSTIPPPPSTPSL
jgi:RimJ/RimL family protein N-acetyltransferase